MPDAEKEEVDMLLQHKCAIKTVKNTDVTSFLQKFKVKPGQKGRRWLHPLDFKNATKMQRANQTWSASQSIIPSSPLCHCYRRMVLK